MKVANHNGYRGSTLSRALVAAILLLLSNFLFPQPILKQKMFNTDSLQEILPTLSGYTRLDALNKLAYGIVVWRGEEGLAYASEAMELAGKEKDREQIAMALFNLGLYEYYHGTYHAAIRYFQQSLDTYRHLGKWQMAGDVSAFLATALYHAGFLEEGGRDINEGYNYYEKAGDQYGMVVGLYGQGFVCNNITGEYDRSLLIHRKALAMCQGSDIPTKIVGGLNAALGYTYSLLGQYDSAIHYYQRGRNILSEDLPDDRVMKIQETRELGSIFLKMGLLDSAEKYIGESIHTSREMGYLFGIALGERFMGLIRERQSRYNEAIGHYTDAADAAWIVARTGNYFDAPEKARILGYAWEVYLRMSPKDKIGSAYESLGNIYNGKARAEEISGDPGSAYKSLQLLRAVKDSLNLMQRTRELAEITAKYESEEKDRLIANMVRQKEINELKMNESRFTVYGLSGMAALILLVSLVLIRQYRLKGQQKALILEQELLRSQMNPHFIFNALANIQSFMVARNEQKASEYLGRFSKLVQNILSGSGQEFVLLSTEVSTLENYLELQQLRYPGKFDYRIEISGDINPSLVMIPPMMLQPFVENAINHGIKYLKREGRLVIAFNLLNKGLDITITDNGVGRKAAAAIEGKLTSPHRSMSTGITQERIMALEKKSRKKTRMEIVDLQNDQGEATGTMVHLWIPVPGIDRKNERMAN